jgi:hypothetical protein
MAVDSTVLFGYLITGRVTSDNETTPHRRCSGDVGHTITGGEFCPVCGSPIMTVYRSVLVKRNFHNLFADTEDRPAWCERLSDRARDFVTDTFAFTGVEDGEDDDEETLIYLDGCVEVDGLETAITPVDIKKLKAPSKRALNTLCDVMGYEHINVRLGLAVITSW